MGAAAVQLPASELARRIRERQLHLREAEQRTHYIRLKPHPYQAEWWFDERPYVVVLAANRVGKSENGGGILTHRTTGQLPVALGGQQEWVDRPLTHAGKFYFACGESFDHIKKVVGEKLLRFLPEDRVTTKYDSAGQLREIYVNDTGATIVLLSYVQAPRIFEGYTWAGGWFDEPPPRAIFTACTRGLLSTGGQVLITATPSLIKKAEQAWVYDELILPSYDERHPLHGKVGYYRVDMHAACIECNGGVGHLHHDAIKTYEATLPERERGARMHGLIPEMQGLEFDYVTEETHVVPDFVVPSHAPIFEVVDPSITRGLYVIWATADVNDLFTIVHAAHIPDVSFAEMCARMRQERSYLPHAPDLAIMDSRGGGMRINMEERETWFDSFRRYGFSYKKAGGKVPWESLHDWLRCQWEDRDGNKVPKLRMTRSVANMDKGPMWGLKRFTWDPTAPYRESYGQPGKDWLDCMRYLAGDQPTPTYERYRHKGAGLVEDFVPAMMQPFTRTRGYSHLSHLSRPLSQRRSNQLGYKGIRIPTGYSD